jgi:hypothetical protein
MANGRTGEERQRRGRSSCRRGCRRSIKVANGAIWNKSNPGWVRYEASQAPDVPQNEECVDQKYGGEREEKVARSGLKKELKLKGWACCNGQRRWGG